MTDDAMVGMHHQCNGHEFEQTQGDREGGQGGLVCCSPWGHKESNTTERLKNSKSQPGVNRYYFLPKLGKSRLGAAHLKKR